ncbi:hypothetical protein JCGZ_00434 [Jatropha curcas]|uniref:non-specific serine/threonine protein kinase n=1 Tax=Jatropha curcas TaxID=180498 RepID=A0A067JG80_JATCU|nr:lectin-domain containing receptor kinase VI.4 [Jatropha curcas]KDP22847.1 hypothetical protein JCGZ_00434 [Jatropha curcas]
MALPIISLPLLILFLYSVSNQAQSDEFIFNGFIGKDNDLLLDRASIFKPTGALRLTNKTANAIGHAFYHKPIQMFTQTSPNASSFNTSFIFSIVPPASGRQGGFGLAFTLSPTHEIAGASPGHYLGLFNESNDGKSSNHILAVEFDTVNGHREITDRDGNHVGININGMSSDASRSAGYTINDTMKQEDLDLHEGKPIQAWIEYDALNTTIKVTICPMWLPKPRTPLIAYPLDLTKYVKEEMYVGFSASTGDYKASSHYILGWSFSTTGAPPELNLSLIPIPPVDKDSKSFQLALIALIVALCFVTVLLFGILFFITVYKRRIGGFENLEDWELECPHRFRYSDLHAATKGFKDSEIIGAGGFGIVYKAVMHSTGNEVAVKKITRNSFHGLKEFAAEIESLGRLRHKHLVNLQGWCKKKNDLLLVYDYIPNGSLESLLFNRKSDVVLSWEQRFNIVKGIAAGLLYLHEEWEQIVIHRDIKSSNVLIDGEMNGRLGDFGLARLYDHGVNSHTTEVVGTVGYIAPELARTGKASTSSDVFAYGILLLEVVTGRRPIGSNQFILADWVLESQQMGRILDVVDLKLDFNYVIEEIELVLKLGLLCSHQKVESRPSTRQVVRYLNREERLPLIEDWGSVDFNRISERKTARLLQVSSCELTSISCTYLSTSSIDAGTGR